MFIQIICDYKSKMYLLVFMNFAKTHIYKVNIYIFIYNIIINYYQCFSTFRVEEYYNAQNWI